MGRAAIVVVGDEILSGHTLDSNSHWLAQQLRDAGQRVLRIETVPDAEEEIARTIQRVAREHSPSWLFVLGGIGPTPDDRTYAGVAKALGCGLDVKPEHVEWLRRRHEEAGLAAAAWADPERSEAYRRMIRLPAGALALENPAGLALGSVCELGAVRVVVLPGVPSEMRSMYLEVFRPRFLPPATPGATVAEIIVQGEEAQYWDALVATERAHPSVRLGSYPQPDGRIILRLSGPAAAVETAQKHLRARVSGR